MTKEELLQKLSEIEWDDFECKRAQDKLPDDVWSTVSAFSNTSGIDKMLKWEKLTKGKVEFASDLVCSTITYWFGDQAKEQAGEQVSGHAGGQVSDQPSDQVSDQPGDQVQKVLNCIRDNVYTMNVLLKKLGISSRRYVRINMLNPAIEGGYVLRAYPDKPNHPNQRYYLSEKGLKLVQ